MLADPIREASKSERQGLAEPVAEPLSVLLLGPYRHQHVDHLAGNLSERGHTVHLAGFASGGRTYTNGHRKVASVTEAPAVADDVPGAARWIREMVGRTGADVIHGQPFHPLYTTASAVAEAAPVVLTPWGSDLLLPKEPRLVDGDGVAARHADAFTADSLVLANRLVELGANAATVQLVRFGVDLNLFRPASDKKRLRAAHGLGKGPVIISPRATTPLYNVTTIVEAFDSVADEHASVELLVKYFTGEPPDLSRVRHHDRIHVVGEVPYERMADYYALADVCISIPSSDASPRSIWEAMACGCACIVSDLPWVSELINPGTDALVVSTEVQAVEGAMRRLVTDPALCDSFASRGRALAETHHNERREIERLEHVYREVAGASMPAVPGGVRATRGEEPPAADQVDRDPAP